MMGLRWIASLIGAFPFARNGSKKPDILERPKEAVSSPCAVHIGAPGFANSATSQGRQEVAGACRWGGIAEAASATAATLGVCRLTRLASGDKGESLGKNRTIEVRKALSLIASFHSIRGMAALLACDLASAFGDASCRCLERSHPGDFNFDRARATAAPRSFPPDDCRQQQAHSLSLI
ncbi:hypothetical protein NKJ90_05560 [Mesorhizobium sp. M0051]|uniref:hypothetical protein n=1 Tax=unclassified Mesorhizobium TaxID=325217 RepID=UPI0004CFA840|nr:hypothetical protein [Mesorhizobium sp. LNHC252B00]